LVEIEKTIEATYLLNDSKKGLKPIFEEISSNMKILKKYMQEDV
jgi:hypothetical protein